MVFFTRSHRAVLAAAALVAVLACPAQGQAAANAFLSGTVVLVGKPVASATVTATGNNIVQATRSDARGRFIFSTLSPGTYVLEATSDDNNGRLRIDLP